MGFAQSLRAAMESRSITMYRLAKSVGVHQSTVSNWLKGSSEPGIATINRIASVLDVKLDYLLSDSTPSDEEIDTRNPPVPSNVTVDDDRNWHVHAPKNEKERQEMEKAFQELPEDAQKAAMDFAKYLLSQRKDTPKE